LGDWVIGRLGDWVIWVGDACERGICCRRWLESGDESPHSKD
jgi:hypothetical protein